MPYKYTHHSLSILSNKKTLFQKGLDVEEYYKDQMWLTFFLKPKISHSNEKDHNYSKDSEKK